MTTRICVLTTARQTEDPWAYLRRTIDQIDDEDLAVEKSVFVDGPRPPDGIMLLEDRGWEVVELERPPGALPGNKPAYFSMLRHLQLLDDVLVLEDDLTFCRNAVRRMATFPVPRDLAWVQFFGPHVLPDRALPGLWRPPMGSHQFTQCLKFGPDTTMRLADWARLDPQFGRFTASDQTLALASQRLGLRYGVHAPELVQHAGDVSSTSDDTELEAGGYRVAKTFPGEAFDALALYGCDWRYR